MSFHSTIKKLTEDKRNDKLTVEGRNDRLFDWIKKEVEISAKNGHDRCTLNFRVTDDHAQSLRNMGFSVSFPVYNTNTTFIDW